ncbi:MAG: protein kinase [Gemmatimonadaceae bacterium]
METPSVNQESLAPETGYAPRSVIAEHYRVERELGRGGMATVYLCTDLRDETQVAIKVLRHELGSAVVIERFLREIAFASELDHPQIPKVLGSGVIDGLPYYVMTYVNGESLKKRIMREAQLPIADALDIMCKVIEPTAYAHKRGIVHRDLKPDNILIADSGVFVLDFGIARAIVESGGDKLTSTGIGVGTPSYMSPEQALGDRALDVRSDVYSLGCVMYEMLAGIPPFVGPTAQVIISRRFAAPPPPLHEVRDNVPESVEEAISKALAKAPADRWPNVTAFGNALKACMNETGARRRIRGLKLPRSTLARAAGGVGFVAVASIGILAWSQLRKSALDKGQDAIRSLDLKDAEQNLRAAVSRTPQSVTANLWLAQAMMLRGAPRDQWKVYALAAGDRASQLDPTDRLRASALAAIAINNMAQGCAQLDSLFQTVQKGNLLDATVPLALADCLRQDSTVLPDKSSPSGYVFRASYQKIKGLYQGLLDRANNPNAYAVIVPRMELVLATGKNLRQGMSPTQQRSVFLAYPSLISDTLAYVPYLYDPSQGILRPHDYEGLTSAIEQNQHTLKDVASQWTRIAPNNPDAHEMLARILEGTGELDGSDHSALQQLLIARKLRRDAPRSSNIAYLDELRLASDEVRINVRRGRFDLVGALADSALSWKPNPALSDSATDVAADWLKNLAALRGQAARVIAIEQRQASGSQSGLLQNGHAVTFPPRLGRDYIALEFYAAFGGPTDSILVVTERIKTNLAADAPTNERRSWEAALLTRWLAMAVPLVGPQPVSEVALNNDLFLRALSVFAKRDYAGARRLLDSVDVVRGDFAPGEISFDVVFQEAWLRAALGDKAGAARQLDNALRGVSGGASGIMRNPLLVASFVRAMTLRAELAAEARQPAEARKWASAVISLWGNGDFVTQPIVERMRKLL